MHHFTKDVERVGTRTCGEPHRRAGAALGLLSLKFENNPFPKECERETDISEWPETWIHSLEAGAGFGDWDNLAPE